MNLLQEALARSGKRPRVLALDPGETTGACVFQGSDLLNYTQLITKSVPEGAATVKGYIIAWQPEVVVMESYRIYSWKTKDHTWASLHTPRLIGAIEYVCYDMELAIKQQSAQQGKGFCTDDKLHEWGLYKEGQKHARDAIRHACYYLLFDVAKVHVQTRPSPDKRG